MSKMLPLCPLSRGVLESNVSGRSELKTATVEVLDQDMAIILPFEEIPSFSFVSDAVTRLNVTRGLNVRCLND